jgi:putative FmdB family regulatory protein
MPVYDYRCGDCGHEFVVIESLGEHEEHEVPKGPTQTCAECTSENVERVISGVHVQTGKKS